ncbi:YiiD C-terminal domain-containing protein [Piscinibacter sp. HJYY11]|uniref:YiiD C-terminal domain-containing protein n=1 Tax=Piscinibacter sp. HJYY11 TaxID=2801333 RepID=UPI00191D98C1|nr:YiiD C-terminal domain-containing protein [Piscinibacter sp. HJYY11]MBL0726276.1 YiiD C-terminal domain-containing protein [Piscinibacter sp. HJYY11]
MTPSEIQTYLHEHIPLSAAMQVQVEVATPEQVVLGAPLQPNINHRDTVFGGSASALAILSAWSLLHVKLSAGGYKTRLVIQRNSMSYEQAILDYFTAHALSPDAERWRAFTRMLERKGRARISVSSTLLYEGQEVGRFEGEFVALGTTGA